LVKDRSDRSENTSTPMRRPTMLPPSASRASSTPRSITGARGAGADRASSMYVSSAIPPPCSLKIECVDRSASVLTAP
jgi:hypothetical protein